MAVTYTPLVPINIASIYQGPLPHRLAQCTPDTKAAIEAGGRDLGGVGVGIRFSDLFPSHEMQGASHAGFVGGGEEAVWSAAGGRVGEGGGGAGNGVAC